MRLSRGSHMACMHAFRQNVEKHVHDVNLHEV